MGFKDFLVKLGILKSGVSKGTYRNASERTDVMGVDEPVSDDNNFDSDSGSDSEN